MMNLIKLLALLLIVAGLLYASYMSTVYAQRNLDGLIQNKRMLLIARVLLLIVGGSVGVLLSIYSLRVSETHVIVGLPFPLAVWEYSSGQWQDYVSPLSIPAAVLNLVVGLALVHFPISVAARVRRRRQRGSAPSAI